MGVFIVGNLLCALAPSYSLLMAARIFCALCHGAFFGLGTVVATALVPRDAWLPPNVPTLPMRLIQEARSLASTQVILAMVVSVLASASLFGVLMYITPILENVTRLSADSVTLMLFLLGGRLGDWSLTP